MSSERYDIKNIEQALEIIKNLGFEEILKKYKKDYPNDFFFTGIYTSKEEILEELQNRIIEGLLFDYNEIKRKISFLRKHGQDPGVLDFRILQVPLKVKVLEANFVLENYEVVRQMLSDAKSRLDDFDLSDY